MNNNAATILDRLLDYSYVFREVNQDLLVELLSELRRRWIFPRQDVRRETYELLGLNSDAQPNDATVREAYIRALFQAFRIYELFAANNMMNDNNDEAVRYRRAFSSIFETIHFSYEYLSAEHRIRIVSNAAGNGVAEASIPSDIALFRFSFPNYEDNTEFQNLLIYLLQTAYKKGYRRYRGKCYEQIRTPEGYLTHAWQEVSDIKTFVMTSVQKETNYQQWLNLTNRKDNPDSATRFLLTFDDPEFPDLKPLRNFFAFRQGLYDARTCAWWRYGVGDPGQSIVAVNYFDLDIDDNIFDHEDWYSLPTPAMQSILLHQKLPEEAIRWIYVFMGRCLYWLNDLDSWQVILFIKGVAGTGKSTIGRVVSSFFPAADVAILSANMEEKFGLWNIAEKLLYVCYEVRHKFSLTQAEFQQMVSGEKMSIPRKGLPTLELEWRTPGLLLGNEVPGWADVANSVNRRTVMSEFKQRVRAPDPELYKKLYKELPVLLHKCNVAYLEAVHHFGKNDIWAELPEYFHETRRNLAANVNSLTSFIMRTDKLELKTNKFMPWSEFTDLYNDYLKANRLSSVRLVGDYFETIFENLGIVFEKHGERVWRGMKTQQHYLLNIGYRDGILEQQNTNANFVADQGSLD